MTTFHVGCLGLVNGKDRYFARLRFCEIDLRPPLPSPKVFASWKKAAPEGFLFAAVAPPTLYGDPTWPLKDVARTRSELDRLVNHVNALGASVLVFRTPLAVTPGSTALKRLFATIDAARKLCPTGTRIVWEPTGVWEHDEAMKARHDPSVIVACDPLHCELAGEPTVYARMRGLGVDTRYDATRLEDLVAALEETEEVFVVFQSNKAWAESIALRRLTAPAGEVPEGDDEDEDTEEDDDEDDEGADDEDEA